MTILEKKLFPLTNDLDFCIQNKTFYAALSLALTLPDICSSLSNGGRTTGKKYSEWLDNYFFSIHHYDVFNSSDLYALRCSFLHNGLNEISEQRAKESLNNFTFFNSYYGNSFVNVSVRSDNNGEEYHETLLNTDIFGLQMIEAVHKFIEENKNDVDINNEASKMMSFVNDKDGFSI